MTTSPEKQVENPCHNCGGTGRELFSVLHPERGYETCGDCGGSGEAPATDEQVAEEWKRAKGEAPDA